MEDAVTRTSFPDYHPTAILHLSHSRWLASSRTISLIRQVVGSRHVFEHWRGEREECMRSRPQFCNLERYSRLISLRLVSGFGPCIAPLFIPLKHFVLVFFWTFFFVPSLRTGILSLLDCADKATTGSLLTLKFIAAIFLLVRGGEKNPIRRFTRIGIDEFRWIGHFHYRRIENISVKSFGSTVIVFKQHSASVKERKTNQKTPRIDVRIVLIVLKEISPSPN